MSRGIQPVRMRGAVSTAIGIKLKINTGTYFIEEHLFLFFSQPNNVSCLDDCTVTSTIGNPGYEAKNIIKYKIKKSFFLTSI
jgi:hypothetical protein